MQGLPATTPDDERARRLRTIDEKEKALNRDAEDAQNAYQGDLQEAYGKVAQKVGAAAVKYAQDNGFTLMLNVGGNQQVPNPVLWFSSAHGHHAGCCERLQHQLGCCGSAAVGSGPGRARAHTTPSGAASHPATTTH